MATEEEVALCTELRAVDGVEEELQSKSSVVFANLLGETLESGQQECLRRVVRACENNIPKAAHVLKTILRWRAEQGLPEILEDEDRMKLFERARPYWPVGFAAQPSEDGCVLEIWRIGQFWPTELLQCCSEEEVGKVWMTHMEMGLQKQREARQSLGRPVVNGHILLFDLSGMARRHLYGAGLSRLKEVLGWSQRYYVENVRAIFVVNAGIIFEAAWVIIKQVLHANTVKKVSVHSDSAIEALASRIGGLDKIPTFLGGTDEASQVGNMERISEGEGEVSVGAGKQHVVTVEVDADREKSDVLEILFESETYDMDLGIYWYAAEKKNVEVELIERKKYHSHVTPQKVEIPNPGPGKVVLIFDNEESMIYGKTLWLQHSWNPAKSA